MSELQSKRIALLRKLAAKYWRPFFSLVAGIPVALHGLEKASGIEGSILPEYASTRDALYWLIGFALFVFIILRFPRIAVTITRLLVGPVKLPSDLKMIFRGPRPYYSNDVLPGRQKEIEDCWMHIQSEAFFILEGESGCGKTSLINAGLLPKLKQRFTVISCRIPEDPFGKLHSALLQEHYHKTEQSVDENILTEAITKTVHLNDKNLTNSQESVRPLLILIDQFEELFVTVKSEVRCRFLATLKEAIKDGKLRLILAIRNDFRDLLYEVCRTVDPDQETLNLGNYYTLRAFSKDQAGEVLGNILEPVYKDEPLISQQVEDFKQALILDLLRSPRDPRLFQREEQTVLPVELQTVGSTIESIGIKHFSVSGLRRLGGKKGLFQAYIEDAKDYAWRKTGVSGKQTLLVLRQLISPAQTKWSQTAQEVGKNLRMPADQAGKVLDAFAEKYLVNSLPLHEGENDISNVTFSKKYELMHEYLVQILAEAPDPNLQKVRDAQERLNFWVSRTKMVFGPLEDKEKRSFRNRLGSFFAQPIPLIESLHLWRFSRNVEERRMLKRNLRHFFLKTIPIGVLMIFGIREYQSFVQQVSPVEDWLVRGRIKGSYPDFMGIDIRTYPPKMVVSSDGMFNYVITARKSGPGGEIWFPSLQITQPGYNSLIMVLRRYSGSDLVFDFDSKTITIPSPIELEAISTEKGMPVWN